MIACATAQERLETFALGQLEEEAARSERDHLATCAECRDAYALERFLIGAARATAVEPVPARFAERVLERWNREEAMRAPVAATAMPTDAPELLRWIIATVARQTWLASNDLRFGLALVWRDALRRLVFGGEHLRTTLARVYATTTSALKLTYQFTT